MLLNEIEAFIERHDLADSAFGRAAINDPRLVSHLRKDPPRKLGRRTQRRIREYMAAQDALLASPQPTNGGQEIGDQRSE